VSSAVALALLSPLLLVIAIAIVMDSPGSPIYRAWRAGKYGRPFRMWKFRTMVTGADRLGPSITASGDTRVTALGELLRRSKLDELPQFVNVLTGDMTLVGPRPEALDITTHYTAAQRAVLDVKPGVTGCVQLEAGCEADGIPAGVAADDYYRQHLMAGKIQRDLDYLIIRTAKTDAAIILRTACYMLRAIRLSERRRVQNAATR
jgi:lipopolysaccharide/colanic/teichoic acid biosynthesis glycosyltransferase